MRNLKLDERSKILDLYHKRKLNISQISQQLGITRNTVRLWIKRDADTGSLEGRPRPPPTFLLDADRVAHMLKVYSSQPFTGTSRFAEEFDCSMRTVRRALHRAGIHYTKPEKTMFLTAQQREARVRFARDYRDLDFTQAIFSDEKSLKSFNSGANKLWRIVGHRKKNEVANESDSQHFSVNVWGWMSAGGPGELLHTKVPSTGQSYVEFLDEVMLPTVRTMYPIEEFPKCYFFQENSAIQRASVVQDWLHQHPEIKMVLFPPRSPDLNPVKSLWRLMIQKWDTNNINKEAFSTHCDDVWESVRGTDICEVLVRSMKDRCNAIIDAGGAPTKYSNMKYDYE